MTQQPPGNHVPHYHYYQYPQPDDPLAPARRAALLMYVIGALATVAGSCLAISGALLPWLMEQLPEFAEGMAEAPELTPEFMRGLFVGVGAVMLIYGLAMILLGLFVRSGSMGAIVTSIVLASLAMLYMAANMIVVLLGAAGGEQIAGVCIGVVTIALLALLLVWLIQASRASGRLRALREQQAAQYWQYYQQQQPGPYAPPPPPPPDQPPQGPQIPPPQY